MTEIRTQQAEIDEASADVFAAARWLGQLWNSSAKAVSAHQIEWQCNTWGSGRGRADWLDTANFEVAAAAFALETSRNLQGRDELIVMVPFDNFSQVADLLDRLGDEPETWPWHAEAGDLDRKINIAAEALGLPPSVVTSNGDLRRALRIE
jgi:hypothetical protein